VFLGDEPASAVVPVPGLGFRGGAVVGSSWVAGSSRSGWFASSEASASGLAVWFRGRSRPLVCLVRAFEGGLDALRASVASAGASGAVVYPVVAVGVSGVAASGFFCGLASEPSAGGASLVAATPVVGSFA